VPYYIQLQGALEEPGVPAKLRLKLTEPDVIATTAASSSEVFSNPKHLDQFLLGSYKIESGSIFVELGMERSPAKIRPYLAADCWVHVPGHIAEVRAGDILQSYRLSGPSFTI
jgi:molybdopterin biosynthesis enzyme